MEKNRYLYADIPAKKIPAYLQFLIDFSGERRDKTFYLLVGTDAPTLVRVHLFVSRWEGRESLQKIECIVEEIDGIEVEEKIRKERAIVIEGMGALSNEEQSSVLKRSLACFNLHGRTVIADDVESHLRVAALRRRLYGKRRVI